MSMENKVALIYSKTKNPMQSGKYGDNAFYVAIINESDSLNAVEPSWVLFKQRTKVEKSVKMFASLEKAIEYSKSVASIYRIINNAKDTKVRPKSYADNFKVNSDE